MVVGNADVKCGFPPSSPDALHLWKRFKKGNKQDTQNPDKVEAKSSNKLIYDKKQTNQSDNFNSSSSNCLGTAEKTITQEKLFRLQCQSQYKKQRHASGFSTDLSGPDAAASIDRKRRYLKSDDYYSNTNDPCVNMTGALHLRKPLSANLDNNKIYYEDRGRMPPVNWKNLTANSSISQEKKPEKIKQAEMQKSTIKNIAKSKLQISDEFSNFVENSVSSKTAYNKQGNIERNVNAIDSPIFKIQQRISNKPLDTIRIPAIVKSSFFKTPFDSHLLNRIDTFRAIDPMRIGNFKSSKVQDERYNYDDNSECNKPKQHKKLLKEDNNYIVEGADNQVESEHQNSKIKRDKQCKDHCPTHECDDYDRITYVNSLTDKENAVKRESRKKEMAFEDDLFTFVQNSQESSSSKISSSLPAPSIRKTNPHSFPFDRIKAVCREKDKSLDSDDTLNVSSDLENISVPTVSMRASFEALKRKMNKLVSSSNNHVSENKCILPDDSTVLESQNQLLNRCLRASHDYLKAPENNVVEITKVKVGSRPEPLFKPISTRYFAKSSTGAEKLPCVNININNNVPIKSLEKDEENINFNSSDNVNNSNTTTSTENVSFDVSNDFTENGFHDKEIDSGLCVKSTDNSLSVSESSETRFDSENDCKKNAQASKEAEASSGVREKSETMKNNSEIISSDSENEEMDCNGVVDYDAFDIENVELFFPALTNLKKTIPSRMVSGMPTENKDSNKSLSDFEIDNNNYSSASANTSSNLNSDSESSSNSKFTFNKNIFENVNIEFSTLRTDGLDYSNNQTQKIAFNNSALKNKNAQSVLCHTSGIVNTSNQSSPHDEIQSVLHEKLCNQTNISKEDSEQNIKNDVVSSQDVEKSKPGNENVAVAPKPVSKKMQKYRTTLENYKHKSSCKSEVDTKEDKTVQQPGNISQIENLNQNPLQRPILKEIQKRMHLTFKPFV